jgi:hypothetical protein
MARGLYRVSPHDSLRFNGLVVGPGETVELEDSEAESILEGNPGCLLKLAAAEPPKPAPAPAAEAPKKGKAKP